MLRNLILVLALSFGAACVATDPCDLNRPLDKRAAYCLTLVGETDLETDTNETDADSDTDTDTDSDTDADTDTDTGDHLNVDDDGDGYSENEGDCDDTSPAFYPGAEENCEDEENDYNCDGATAYTDGDKDGFPACEECDDADDLINPDALEVCDKTDNDCNGEIDDGVLITFYKDFDGDSVGVDYVPTNVDACEQPSGYVTVFGDCNDVDENVSPLLSEVCDDLNVDEDCDELADDDRGAEAEGKYTFCIDADHDTYVSSTDCSSCELATCQTLYEDATLVETTDVDHDGYATCDELDRYDDDDTDASVH